MLARSAGRRHQRHASRVLASSFAQLNLPWLAPAQLRWNASHTASSQPAPRPRRTSDSKVSQQARAQIRQLATSAEPFAVRHDAAYPPNPAEPLQRTTPDANIPWDFSSQHATEPSISKLRPSADPIIINSTVAKPNELIKAMNGVTGTSLDLLQHLYTTLRVGRISRAETIIQRLAQASPPDSPEVVHAHTAYLEELLRHLAAADSDMRPSFQLKMQKWFEVEVYRNNVQPDEKILIVMIRAAIRGLQGSQRDRAIRRYVEMARKLGELELDEVMYSEDYDDNEFTILGTATSDFYEEPPEVESEATSAVPVPELDMTKFRRLDTISMDELPEIIATEQKGEGLESVKTALEAFTKLPALPADAPIEAQRARALERQRNMEVTSVEVAVARWRKEDESLKKIGISSAMQTKPMGALMWQWYTALVPALEEELALCQKAQSSTHKEVARDKSHDRLTYAPYFELLPIRKIAANTVLFTMGLITRGKDKDNKFDHEVRLAQIITGLGKAIEEECAIENSKRLRLENQRKAGIAAKRRAAATKQGQEPDPVEFSQDLPVTQDSRTLSQKRNRSIKSSLSWSLDVKAKMGAMLASKLIETAQFPVTKPHPRTKEKITQLQPAFLHRMKYRLGKKVGVVQPNAHLIKKIESEPLGALLAKRMPMIVEPRPWTGWNEGGYLQYPTPIVRLPQTDKSGKDYFMAADMKGDTKQVYAGLNALSKVPWKIHHEVLKVQLHAWNSGEAIANLAPLNVIFNPIPEPEPSTDPEPRRRWLQEVREQENKRVGLHSQRCFQNFQLEIAKALANETLYFPHNVDFRGRAYPIPPYLNHMGADNARGLLVFGEGKPLGVVGLRWLKIHLANVSGYDKASLQEREDYTMAHLDDIYDSVRNPLDGRRWWLESEDAWQTLAACFELTKALDSPDPTKFVSHLPTHQDGTCNGLQHYAALGGDKAGAAQVNLEPSDRPADIYTAVANAVNAEVERDAEAGNPIAKMLQGHVKRKLVKQPVMTNVYGVTFYGAKAQVRKQLVDIFPDLSRFAEVNHGNLANYVATKIFKSLGSMFTGAQAIQVWLGTCADRISTCLSPEQIEQLTTQVDDEVKAKEAAKVEKAATKVRIRASRNSKDVANEVKAAKMLTTHGGTDAEKSMNKTKPLFKSSVTWTTPLRMPVVQPYRSASSRIVMTNLQAITLQEPQVWDPVSKRKQLQAFPPNFIHSLDATHMMLSVLKCNEVGLTFASIHDSFWTHACDIEQMSEVLRDAFVAMHSEDIIGRLREEFVTRYKGHMYLATVMANSKIGQEITALRKSQKGKTGQAPELALEKRRLDLLASKDPEERAQGADMITPASIMESAADESEYILGPDMEGQTLGELPEHADTLVDSAPSAEDVEAAADSVSPADPKAAEDVSEDWVGKDIEEKNRKNNAKKRSERKLFVWLPMKFPEVPAKGDFDVKRLKLSKYFFH
jgi:DNA-directed RNA polymerase